LTESPTAVTSRSNTATQLSSINSDDVNTSAVHVLMT